MAPSSSSSSSSMLFLVVALVFVAAQWVEADQTVLHNHMSRKVFDRACAASKDTVDEIVQCIIGNENIRKHVSPTVASTCYETNFGVKFLEKDIQGHKEMICKNRDKFEQMTACIYRETTKSMGPKEIELLTEAMVDVGLCIVNALN